MAKAHFETQWTSFLLLREIARGLVPNLGASRVATSTDDDSPNVTFLSSSHLKVLQDASLYTNPEKALCVELEWALLLEFFETKVRPIPNLNFANDFNNEFLLMHRMLISRMTSVLLFEKKPDFMIC